MTDDRPNESSTADRSFVQQVSVKVTRKIRALKDGQQTVWFGLGMSGLIGWSVAVPTVLGAMLGLWWDNHHPGAHSWTLMLLTVGLCVGCANAWHWVDQESKAMQDRKDDKHE
jgi:ATP synthase protein I